MLKSDTYKFYLSNPNYQKPEDFPFEADPEKHAWDYGSVRCTPLVCSLYVLALTENGSLPQFMELFTDKLSKKVLGSLDMMTSPRRATRLSTDVKMGVRGGRSGWRSWLPASDCP